MATGLIVSGLINIGIGLLTRYLAAKAAATDTTAEGPRLSDTSVTSSAYGVAINVADGTIRLNGNIIWAGDGLIEEVVLNTEETALKNSPSSSFTQVEYRYFLNWAIAFSEGEAEALLKAWGDGKKIIDATGKTKTSKHKFTFYEGTNTQVADPLIVSHIDAKHGAGSTPAYLNMCYIVFERMALADFSNRPPIVTALITFVAAPNYPRDDMVIVSGFINDSPNEFRFHAPTNQLLVHSNTNLMTVDDSSFIGLDRFDNSDQGSYSSFSLMCSEEAYIASGAQPGPGTQSNGNGKYDINTGELISIRGVNGGELGVNNSFSWVNSKTWADHTIKIELPGQGVVGEITAASGFFGGINVFEAKSMTFQEIGETTIFDGMFDNTNATHPLITDVSRNVIFLWSRWSTIDSLKLFKIEWDGTWNPEGLGSDATTIYADGPQFGVTVTAIGSYTSTQLWGTASYNFNGSLFLESENAFIVSGATGSAGALAKIDVVSGSIVDTVPSTGYESFVGFHHKVSGNRFAYPQTDGSIIEMSTVDLSVLNVNVGTDIISPAGADSGFYFDEERYAIVIDRVFPAGPGTPDITRIYLGKHSGLGVPLNQVQARYLDRTEWYDTTGADYVLSPLAGITVDGNVLARPGMTAAEASFILQQAYRYDLVEEDFRLKAVLRGGSSVLTIPQNEIGKVPKSDKDIAPIKEVRIQEVELPETVEVLHSDASIDYQQNVEFQKRVSLPNPTMSSRDTIRIDLGPLVESRTDAKQLAETWLYTFWQERINIETTVPWKYMKLSPADVITLQFDGEDRKLRLEELEIGAKLPIEIKGVQEDESTSTSTVVASLEDGHVSDDLDVFGFSKALLMDAPVLSASDDSGGTFLRGYVGLSGFGASGWPGAALLCSIDNGNTWNVLTTTSAAAAWGYMDTAPTDVDAITHNHFQEVVDGGEFIVTMRDGGSKLASATESAILESKSNAAALISPDKKVEIIAFQDVVNGSGETYTLSRLLRGRQGTEDISSGSYIVPGSVFVLLEIPEIHIIANLLANINRPLLYRAVTAGQSLADGVEIFHTDTGRDLQPYSPVFLDATASASGGLDTSWVRRTRFNGEWIDNTGEVPLNEDSESYTVTLRTPGFNDLIDGSENFTFFYVDANTTADDQGDLALAATVGSEVTIQGVQVTGGVGALEFSPSGNNSFDSVVTYSDPAALELTNLPFTISADVRFKSLTETVQTIVAKARETNLGNAWAFEYEGGGLTFRSYDGGAVIEVDVNAAWVPVINTWYTVAVTRDASNDYRLYVDGLQIGSTQNDTTTITETTASITLGSREDGISTDNEPLYGFLDNVLIVAGAALYTGTSYTVVRDTLGLTLASKTVVNATSTSFTEAEIEGDSASTDGTPQLIDDFGTDPDGGGGWSAISGTTLSSVASSGNISAPPGASGDANFALQTAAGTDGVRYGMTKVFDPIADGPFTSTTEYNGSTSVHVDVWVAADVVTEQTVEILVDVLDMDGVTLGPTFSSGQVTLASNGVWEAISVHAALVPRARSIRVELAHTGTGTGATAVGFDVLEMATHVPPGGIILEVVQNSSVPAVTGIPATKTVT